MTKMLSFYTSFINIITHGNYGKTRDPTIVKGMEKVVYVINYYPFVSLSILMINKWMYKDKNHSHIPLIDNFTIRSQIKM